MDQPRIIVNAKAYPEVTGREATYKLARACQDAAAEAGTRIGLALPLAQLATVGRFYGFTRIVPLAQHVDPHAPGAATGWVTIEAIREAGAKGALLNHAEHKLDFKVLQATHERLHAQGLLSILCADSLREVKRLAGLRPTFLAIEPPQLIGGEVSVTSADPKIVSEAVEATRAKSPETLTLCGAGVKNSQDLAKAIELGAHGVLLASGVVRAPDAHHALRDLCRALP